MIPNVLSIAGSDPSGGAGIQADLKSIAANGGYGMAALTALTAQNTQGVTGIELIAPEFVGRQIDAVFSDILVDAVKIGMIATAGIARAVAEALTRHGAGNVVLDPVMVAKGGDRLLAEDAVEVLAQGLLPIASIVTPNLPEAAALAGTEEPRTRDEMPGLARRVLALGPKAVLLKGGHLTGPDSPDLLVTAETETWLEGPRLATKNTHGTGCTLSSALAVQLARSSGDAIKAAQAAKAYVTRALSGADELRVGQGIGPLNHFKGGVNPYGI